MRGLEVIPDTRAFEEAYEEFSRSTPSEARAARTSQWTRFDARFTEIWIDALSRGWKRWSPFLFREELLRQPWPEAFGVLSAQLLDFGPTYGKISKEEVVLFRHWSELVLEGVDAASGESFLIGQAPFAGKSLERDAERSLGSFLRWGYFGVEIFFNKALERGVESVPRGTIPKESRIRVLEELVRTRPRLTVRDYLEALPAPISRRQAELDLEAFPRLRKRGKTKGRFFVPFGRGRERR